MLEKENPTMLEKEKGTRDGNEKCKHCLPDCQLATYSSSLTALPFRFLASDDYFFQAL